MRVLRTSGANGDDPLVVERLTKTYPGPVEAVRGISFTVAPGEIFGLLGPNGAGKTTTIGVLTTLVEATSGSAQVGGHDVGRDPVAVRRSIGVVFQDSVLDNDFTGAENMLLHARLWRVPDARKRVESLLAAVGLADRAADGVRTYSGGMRRRLEIARALLARPEVLVLDEPTLGLDPIVRRDLWDVVQTLRDLHGVTILLSTHYLEEAQSVCDRVAIVDKGLIVAEGSPAELVASLGEQIIALTIDAERDANVMQALAALDPPLGSAMRAGSTLSVASGEHAQALTNRINALPLAEIGVSAITVRRATLNDVFLHLTAPQQSGALRRVTRAESG